MRTCKTVPPPPPPGGAKVVPQTQGLKVELPLQDLKVIIKRLLLSFYRATAGKKPEKLILYRDGVSEGMFAEVQRAEIPQILQACKYDFPAPLHI